MDASAFMRCFYKTGTLRVLFHLIPKQKAKLAYCNSFCYINCITFHVLSYS